MSGPGGNGARTLTIDWRAPGPISDAFRRSNAAVKVLMGPIGSGKTHTAIYDLFRRSLSQPASPVDGIRRYKIGVVRATYRQLWGSTIPSWHELFPPDFGDWSGGKDQPARHILKTGDWELVAEFLALGEQSFEVVLRGLQVSAWLLEEIDTLPIEVVQFCVSRAGRHPHKEHGFPWWYGVSGTANAFDVDSEHYRRFVEERAQGWELFVQPGGLDPAAENRQNLVPDYYERLCGDPKNDELFIRRYVHNQFGYSRDGKPVFPEFHDAVHVAAEAFAPNPALPLVIGADAGLTPAAVLLQRTPAGQWLAVDEVVMEGGATAFGEALNRKLAEPGWRELLAERRAVPSFRREQVAQCWCDPAAEARSATDERTWIEVVSAVTGLRFRAAPSNAPSIRLDAVRQPLTRLIDGRQPGLLISPRCRALRRGFNSTYRYKRIWVAGRASYLDQPEKNESSHVHDALQYALLGGGEFLAVRGRRETRRAMPGQPRFAITDRSPLAAGGPRYAVH
jgi:hypothetical protein